jgi:hypothetical protein
VAQLLFWAAMLFFAVQGVTGLYVAVRYGSDMVGSDLHFNLAFTWTWRIIATLAVCYGLLLLKVFYILQIPVFEYMGVFFKTVLDLLWTIVTA